MISNIKIISSIFCLVSIFPNFVFAAPNISNVSGETLRNSQLVVSGSGFKTKNPTAPLLWDTIESPQPQIGSWMSVPCSKENSIMRTGNNSLKCKAGTWGGTGSQAPRVALEMDNNEKVFVSFWRRYNYDILDSTQQKFFRFYKDVGNSFAAVWLVPYLIANQEICENAQWFGIGKEPVANIWYNEQYLMRGVSQDGVADGFFAFNRYGSQGAAGTLVSRSNVPYKCSDQGKFTNLYLDQYGINIPVDSYAYIDDVYIDNTWARIELGNASIWNTSTHREIQIPSSWNDNSIVFTFNQGAFQSGQTTYLYIIDENGSVNANGFPVIIGGDSPDLIPPFSPSGLSVR